MPSHTRSLLALLSGLILAGCAGPMPVRPARASDLIPGPVQQTTPQLQPSLQERALVQELQSLYSRAAYSEVIEKARAFESRFKRSARMPEVLNLKGLSLLLTRKLEESISCFRAAIDRVPDAFAGDRNWKNYVRYNLAAAYLEAGSPKSTLEELQAVDPETLDASNRVKFHQLRARAQENSGNLVGAAREWIEFSKQSQARGLDVSKNLMDAPFESILGKIQDRDQLEDLFEAADKTPLAPLALFRLIQRELDEGKSSKASERIREFLRLHAASPKATEVGQWLRGLREGDVAAELSIGLLVPQTGKFARFGQKVIQGVSLALGIFDGFEADGRIQLVIEDCGDDPETALRALERLHSVHRVAAVIGPILSKGADQVLARAEDHRLPLISLAQSSGKPGEFATLGAVTPKLQAEEIAKHAVQGLGLRKFAILSPRGRFGEEYSQEFWAAVERLGGSITAYETYDSGETDFRTAMERLSGTYYADARKRELFALARERETNNIKKRTRKTEKYFTLAPVVNFEAVFIPDEPKAVGLALPTFTYKDIDGVKFLGISAWNSPEMLQRAQQSAEGSYFVDSYFPLATSPVVRRFAERFRSAFGQEATSLEAMAFDAATQLERIVSSEAGRSGIDRNKVAIRIRQLIDVPGVTGSVTVRDGYWARDLKVLTVRDQQVVEAPRSERSRSARPAD